MNVKLSQLIFRPLKHDAISRETGLNSSKKKIRLCFISCCLMSCILPFLFQFVSQFQNNNGSRLPVNTLSPIQLFSGPSGNVRDNSVPGRHIFCEADLTRMQPSINPISEASSPASVRKISTQIRFWSIWSRKSPPVKTLRRLRSHWPGCWPKSRGLFPFPEQQSLRGLRKI